MSDTQWKSALEKANQAKRCGAKTRCGQSCQSPAMINGRCRMHGGKSPGAPCGKKHGRYRSGYYTKEAQLDRVYVMRLLRDTKKVAQLVGQS